MGKLTVKQVAALFEPGRYLDGDGLYLSIDSNRRRYWLLRYQIDGKRRDMSLGPVDAVSLATAREKALRARMDKQDGIDPLAARVKAKSDAMTFEEAARKVHADQSGGWRPGKHGEQWIATMENHVFPKIGAKPVADVSRADVVAILMPIWLRIPETARRVKQRIGAVLDWAAGEELREDGVNMSIVVRALPRQKRKVKHFSSMPYQDVPAFLLDWQNANVTATVRIALEILILTASRPGNIQTMRWEDIDLKAALWSVEAADMKADEDHRVPLSPRAVALLELVKGSVEKPTGLVFKGRSDGKTISENTLREPLKRMGLDYVPHGFRSSFKCWADESGWREKDSEKALAHTEPNKTKRAYARSELLNIRRMMMNFWADYLAGGDAPVGETNAMPFPPAILRLMSQFATSSHATMQ